MISGCFQQDVYKRQELYTKELEEQSPVALTIQQLLDSVENEQLLQILLESDKKTLQILLLKMWGFSIREIAEQTGCLLYTSLWEWVSVWS